MTVDEANTVVSIKGREFYNAIKTAQSALTAAPVSDDPQAQASALKAANAIEQAGAELVALAQTIRRRHTRGLN